MREFVKSKVLRLENEKKKSLENKSDGLTSVLAGRHCESGDCTVGRVQLAKIARMVGSIFRLAE